MLDSWDAADDSEEERKKQAKKKAAEEKAAAEAAANKKSKAERVAEKQSEHAAERAAKDAEDEEEEKLTPAERRARDQQRQIDADLNHAADLFGDVGIGAGSGTSDRKKPLSVVADPADPTRTIDLSALPLFAPTTKDGFTKLREVLVPLLTQNTKKGNYPLFIQEFARLLCKDMSSENVRKAASGLTTLANEKQKEEKESQKKGTKKKAAPKAALVGTAKDVDRIDTTNYDQTYDDL